MSSVALVYNLCEEDLVLRINGGEPQRVASVGFHPNNEDDPVSVNYVVVPQVWCEGVYGAWQFSIDSEPVLNTLSFQLEDSLADPI
ncbi:MAG: hypothetical protein ACYTGQ_07450, partial [Planctomycetota bacterium]